MTIFLNTTETNQIYLGAHLVKKVYIGDVVAWEPPSLHRELNESWTPKYDNLQAYYKLDDTFTTGGTVLDHKGPYNGTSTTGITSEEGKIEKCAAFDATSPHTIACPTSLIDDHIANKTKLTIMCWTNVASISNHTAFVVCNTGGGTGLTFGIRDDNYIFCNARHWTGSGGNTFVQVLSTTTFTYNKWNHVAVVFDFPAAVATIYLNGVSDGTVALPTGNQIYCLSTTRGVDLGYWSDLGVTVNGKIDDVSIFDDALSSADITTVYDRQSKVYLNASEVALRFEGDTLTDSSGNNALVTQTGTVTHNQSGDPNLKSEKGKWFDHTTISDYLKIDKSSTAAIKALRPDNTSTNDFSMSFFFYFTTAQSSSIGLHTIFTQETSNWVISVHGNVALVRAPSAYSGSFSQGDSSTQLTPDEWHHVVMNFDGTTKLFQIIIDGVDKGNTTTTSDYYFADNKDYFFLSMNIPNQYLVGRVSDFMLINRKLTVMESEAISVGHYTVVHPEVDPELIYDSEGLTYTPTGAEFASAAAIVYDWRVNDKSIAPINMNFAANNIGTTVKNFADNALDGTISATDQWNSVNKSYLMSAVNITLPDIGSKLLQSGEGKNKASSVINFRSTDFQASGTYGDDLAFSVLGGVTNKIQQTSMNSIVSDFSTTAVYDGHGGMLPIQYAELGNFNNRTVTADTNGTWNVFYDSFLMYLTGRSSTLTWPANAYIGSSTGNPNKAEVRSIQIFNIILPNDQIFHFDQGNYNKLDTDVLDQNPGSWKCVATPIAADGSIGTPKISETKIVTTVHQARWNLIHDAKPICWYRANDTGTGILFERGVDPGSHVAPIIPSGMNNASAEYQNQYAFSHDMLKINTGTLTTVETVFTVVKFNNHTVYRESTLFGALNSVDYSADHFSSHYIISTVYASQEVRNGSHRLDNVSVDFKATPRDSNLHIFHIENETVGGKSRIENQMQYGSFLGLRLNGVVYETIIFDRRITVDEQANIYNYLNAKWKS